MDQREPFDERLARWYTVVRSSVWFPVGLLTFVTVWYVVDLITDFDPGLVVLLTLLSVEASIATAFLSRDLALVERDQRKQMEYMVDLMEAVLTVVQSIQHKDSEQK